MLMGNIIIVEMSISVCALSYFGATFRFHFTQIPLPEMAI